MDDDAMPTMGVLELMEEQFLVVHMECLRLFIGLWRLYEQRETLRRRGAIEETEDERFLRDEFETELTNLHDLLTCESMTSVDVLEMVRSSISKYLPAWPGASEALERWWSPRRDKATALASDLVIVMPGLWLGSDVTLKPANQALLRARRIRHVVTCDATAIDNDDDYLHGAQHAREPKDGEVSPLIQTSQPDDHGIQHHRIVLFELGRMEFLVRRRDKTLPRGMSQSLDAVSFYVQALLADLRQNQCDELAALRVHDVEYVDEFDGVLLCCETGSRASIVVCVALLMRELQLSYALALRVVECARRYVSPCEFFDHVLSEYQAYLEDQREPNAYFPPVGNGIN